MVKDTVLDALDKGSSFYRTQVYLGSDLWVQVSVTNWLFVDLADVSLVDEDTNPILADDTKRTIPGNLEMVEPNFRISTKFQDFNQISVRDVIQVIDSIPWVRCASGNVWSKSWNLAKILKFWNLVKILKFALNSEIWLKSWNLVEILKFGWNPEIWVKFWNLVKILKLGQNPEIWSKSWNLVEILKFGQNPEIWHKSWNSEI